jgi:hypothetical protein
VAETDAQVTLIKLWARSSYGSIAKITKVGGQHWENGKCFRPVKLLGENGKTIEIVLEINGNSVRDKVVQLDEVIPLMRAMDDVNAKGGHPEPKLAARWEAMRDELESSPSEAKKDSHPLSPLIPLRTWTDQQQRKLEASLASVFKNSDGVYEGIFEKPSGETFNYVIGKLGTEDVELVKRVMKEKGMADGSPRQPR